MKISYTCYITELVDFYYSQLSPNFKHQPIWLQSFLALFNCESVPNILFARAAQPSTRWGNAGELVRVDLNCLHLVHPEFERLLGQPPWSERFANIEDRRSHVEDLIERGDADADGLGKGSKESLLTILTIAASAFPEPVCVISRRHSLPSRMPQRLIFSVKVIFY
jgi:hypothetical protein